MLGRSGWSMSVQVASSAGRFSPRFGVPLEIVAIVKQR